MIKNYEKKAQKNGENTKVNFLYIGVYTTSSVPSSFSILITRKKGFSPILLMNG